MKRRVFYSFHYVPDSWRAAQVRNIGSVEGNSPATDNAWEALRRGGDEAIRRWIARQMKYRSCSVVLVGANTANRKWINYEIAKAWNDGMGVVGIRIHGLQNQHRRLSSRGANPFDYLPLGKKRLSSVVKCYNPAGTDSAARYAWISKHLKNAVEEAIRIRNAY